MIQSESEKEALLGPRKVPIIEDELDDAFSKLHPKDDGIESAAGLEEELMLSSARDEEEEDEEALVEGSREEHKGHAKASPEDLDAEAKAKGYGKLYAAFGGGLEGLEACVAVEALCEVREG